tara:strand:- start:2445 stop:2600 length:156 start_codon:yes stop_codon:yes gene_type:complete
MKIGKSYVDNLKIFEAGIAQKRQTLAAPPSSLCDFDATGLPSFRSAKSDCY